jgi:glycerol-3-phosphate acyltransferase PlsX
MTQGDWTLNVPDGRAGTADSARRPVIAVDAMGGDHAPGEVVAGAAAAVREHGSRVVLVGPPAEIRPLLAEHDATRRIPIVPAEDTIAMDEGALAVWRRPRSGAAVACQMIRRGQAAAMVSAGSTGGVVSTARLRLKLLPGVLRPGLAVLLPSQPKPTVLIDAGAIADPKPEMLVQFAQLGSIYAQIALGITRPRVGLLTIGTESGKGNKLVRRVHELLAAEATSPNETNRLDFAGNLEGGDLMAGRVDVIVTDGFTGNVALKTLEGTARYIADQVRAAMAGNRLARLGAIFSRRRLRQLSSRIDPEAQGGAALLGLNGLVVIAHGASTARGITSACALAAKLAEGQLADEISARLGGGAGRGAHFLRLPSHRDGSAHDGSARESSQHES